MQKIYEIAENEEIYIAYKNLQHEVGNIQGLYTVHPRAGPVIVLDKSLLNNTKEHRCVAAHELGHHFYPPRSAIAGIVSFHRGNFSGQREITINQDENKALRWATELLMPSAEVWDAIKGGCNTLPQLAERFHVEEWFVRFKIGFIRREERNRGRKLRWKDIICKKATTDPQARPRPKAKAHSYE